MPPPSSSDVSCACITVEDLPFPSARTSGWRETTSADAAMHSPALMTSRRVRLLIPRRAGSRRLGGVLSFWRIGVRLTGPQPNVLRRIFVSLPGVRIDPRHGDYAAPVGVGRRFALPDAPGEQRPGVAVMAHQHPAVHFAPVPERPVKKV